jgi:hypothetical protein
MRIDVFLMLLFLLTPMFSGCIGDEQSKITVEGTFEDGRDSGAIWDSFESNEGEELTFSVAEMETCVRDDDDPTQPEETACNPKDVVIQSSCVGGLGDYTTPVAKGATIGGSGLECDHDVVGLYEEGYLNATWRFVIEITSV